MTDWTRDLVLPNGLVTITPFCLASIGAVTGALGTPASATWPLASRAIFIPFRISRSILVLNMFTFNGAVVNGNLDIGLLDAVGTRLVSSGSTAQAGINQIQTLNIADTLVGPGQFYIALAMDNIVGTFFRSNFSAPKVAVVGMLQQVAAFPLPAAAVFALGALSYIPVCGLTARSPV